MKTLTIPNIEPIELAHTARYEVWTTINNRPIVLLVSKREAKALVPDTETRPLPPALDMSWVWNRTERRWVKNGEPANCNSQGNAAVASQVPINTNDETKKS